MEELDGMCESRWNSYASAGNFPSGFHMSATCPNAEMVAENLEMSPIWENTEISLAPIQNDIDTLSMQPTITGQDFLCKELENIAGLTGSQRGFAYIADGESLVLQAAYIDGMLKSCPFQDQQPSVLQIGSENLPEQERSLAGRIAHAKMAHWTESVGEDPWCQTLNHIAKSALGVPIFFGGKVLGVIVLLHSRCSYYTYKHVCFLRNAAWLIAKPLGRLLTRRRRPLKDVRKAIKGVFNAMETDDDLWTSSEVLTALAGQVAEALDSKLCTIWHLNPEQTALTVQGEFGLSKIPLDDQGIRGYSIEQRAMLDVCGSLSKSSEKSDEIIDQPLVWQAILAEEINNYGPNRNPQFFRGTFARPCILAPLHTYDDQPIGLIHVGLKKLTTENPLGCYSEKDEYRLEVIRWEISRALECRRFHKDVQSAA